MATVAYAWECDVTIEGPSVIKEGQTITLSATGAPDGGSYDWFNTPNLESYGATATLTAFKPQNTEYILVGVSYTNPKGKKCSDRKYIWYCECYTRINGPDTVNVGESITLTVEDDPSGGTLQWTPIEGLVVNGDSATFTGQTPGEVSLEVTYTAPSGKSCTDTHRVAVEEPCSVTIDGPIEVRVGETINLTADGQPANGTFQWATIPGLVANGSGLNLPANRPGRLPLRLLIKGRTAQKPAPLPTRSAFMGVICRSRERPPA